MLSTELRVCWYPLYLNGLSSIKVKVLTPGAPQSHVLLCSFICPPFLGIIPRLLVYAVQLFSVQRVRSAPIRAMLDLPLTGYFGLIL